MDFLNSNVGFEYTDRDTFRRIKYSFDQIGNHIEANKYFKDEMEKYRLELKEKKGHFWEKFVFWVNKFTSDYGQSYARPIALIFLTMFIHTFIKIGYQENWFYGHFEIFDSYLDSIAKGLNYFADSLIPVNKFLNQGFELLSLFFYVCYVVLIYQTVVALKRLTKR